MAHVEEVDKATLWGGNGSPFRLTYGKQMMWFFLVSDALTFGGLLITYMFARHAVPTWPIPEKVFHAMPGLDGHYPLLYVALMTFILIVSSVTMVLAVEAGHRKNKRGVIKWLAWTVVGGFIFVGSQAWEWAHFIHGSHHGTVLTEEGWGNISELNYKLDDHGHMIMNAEGAYIVESVELLMIDNMYEEKTGEEALALYNGHTDFVQGANLVQNEYAPNAPAFADLFFFITGFHGFHVFSGVIINLIILIQVVRGTYDKRGHFEMVEKVGLYWHFVDLVWVFVFTFFYLL